MYRRIACKAIKTPVLKKLFEDLTGFLIPEGALGISEMGVSGDIDAECLQFWKPGLKQCDQLVQLFIERNRLPSFQ